MPLGLRSRVPEKITSSMRDPRSVLADCSPNTQEMASAMFDLPQPLGPMMAAMPSPWDFNSVRSLKDLKPRIWSLFSLSNGNSLRAVRAVGLADRQPGLPTRFLHARNSRALYPGWEGRAQIRGIVTAKSRRGQVIKHHIWYGPKRQLSICHTQCS